MDSRRAWYQLIGTIATLALLAVLLPPPWSADAGRQRAASTGTGSRAVLPAEGLDVVQGVVLQVCAIAVWLLMSWSSLVAAAAVLARIPGRPGLFAGRWLARIAPATVRRLLITTVGLTVLTGLAGCATDAGHGASNVRETAAAAGSAALAGSRLPSVDDAEQADRSIDAGTAGEPSPPGGAAGLRSAEPMWVASHSGSGVDGSGGSGTGGGSGAGSGSGSGTGIDLDWPGGSAGPKSGTQPDPVVVLRGDSLWRIAARHLPPEASDAQIDSAWRAWYEANRTVIGPQPDLILPGQQLLPPSSGTGSSS